jgi:hypothetical protein
MKSVADCFGRKIRLTDERMAHTLEHPEMKEMGMEIERVLRKPQLVRRSRSDATARLFMNFTRRQLWVANGCVLWLNMWRTTRLWSRLT